MDCVLITVQAVCHIVSKSKMWLNMNHLFHLALLALENKQIGSEGRLALLLNPWIQTWIPSLSATAAKKYIINENGLRTVLGIIYSISDSSPHSYFLFAQERGQSYLCSRSSSDTGDIYIDTGDTLTDVTVWSDDLKSGPAPFFFPPHWTVAPRCCQLLWSHRGNRKWEKKSVSKAHLHPPLSKETGLQRAAGGSNATTPPTCVTNRGCVRLSNRHVIEGNAAS